MKLERQLRLAAFAVILTWTRLLGAAIPPAENLLPADTLAFFAAPDAAASRADARTWPGWMFWNDPAMKPFHDKFMAKWHEQVDVPLERNLGVNVDDFERLLQGQFTVALTANGSNGHDDISPGLLLLLDAKGQSAALKTNLAAIIKSWTDAGRTLRTEQFHGLSFTVAQLSTNDLAGIFPKKTPVSEIGVPPEKPAKPGEIYVTQFESLLVVGNSPKVVGPVAAHLTGGSEPAIADNPIFAADKLSQFREHPQYYGWFNGKGFLGLINQANVANGGDDSQSPSIAGVKALGALGLTGLKSASFALRESGDGTMLSIHISAPDSDRAGLLKILALPDKDASVPPFVPADALKFTRVRLDGKQTWAELQKMIANLAPSGQAGLDAVIKMANTVGQQKNPGFDIRNDLFGNLKDDMMMYQKPAKGSSIEDLNNAPSVYLVAVSNPESAINAIKTLATLANPQAADAQPQDFMGRKIYRIALRSAMGPAGGGTPGQTLYVSFSGGYLALSSDSGIVEEFIRNAEGQNKQLREDPGLMNAMQHLGGAGGGLFGYENQRESMRSAFKAMHSAMAIDDTMKMFPPTLREWLDFSLLPDYDAVSKYFYISTFGGSADSEGLTFKVFTPRPPRL